MVADSNIIYNERDQTMDCIGCLTRIEVPRRLLSDPDGFVSMLEHAQLDHKDCHKFASITEANNHRRYRKERDRRLLVKIPVGRA